MKASIKFREENQKPLLKAKIPINIINLPFRSSISAGETKELSLNLSTLFQTGPCLRFSYRPNDSKNPFSLIFKTGSGHFGSPNKSPLSMTAEFNLIGNQNPSFFIHFKPNFGDFTIKKSNSSSDNFNLGENLQNGDVLGNGFFPSETRARIVMDRVLRGTEISARTVVPVRDFGVLNFRWGVRVPAKEDKIENVDNKNRKAGIRLPYLVMNKIGIEHVAVKKKETKKVGDEVSDMCLEVKKQVEVIRGENGMLSKALSDLRSDIAAGKLDFLNEYQRRGNVDSKKYSGGGGGDKKGLEGNDGLKVGV